MTNQLKSSDWKGSTERIVKAIGLPPKVGGWASRPAGFNQRHDNPTINDPLLVS